jgi:hypothetical protein
MGVLSEPQVQTLDRFPARCPEESMPPPACAAILEGRRHLATLQGGPLKHRHSAWNTIASPGQPVEANCVILLWS